MATEDKTTEPRKSTAASRTSNQQSAAGGDVADRLRTAHEARVTVPGASNVDARLDNRTGADRPPLESFPAKPQQIDGPDVMHQVEHTRRTLKQREQEAGDRKGMFSPGPHGLSDERLREGETTFGTEGLTEAEAAKGSPKAAG
jgi:hypothetical protein